MEMLKVVASCLYIFGIPSLLGYLLIRNRSRKLRLPVAGRALLVIGSFMSLATLATYIPILPTALQRSREVFHREVIALIVWLLPSVILVSMGWTLRRP